MSMPHGGQDVQSDEAADQGRTTAEWVSLIISSTIVLALVGVIVYLYLAEGTKEPFFEVLPQMNEITLHEDLHYLPVTIENLGGDTAEDVRVMVTLTGSEGEEESAEFEIDFLAAGATNEGVVVFRGDPREGDLIAQVSSFRNP